MFLGQKEVGESKPVYFIADIGANHDGSLKRARELIRQCADSGADAAKFQNFFAETIVSDIGFKNLDAKSHQSTWKESVYSVYDKASLSLEWTESIKEECDKNGLAYMTSPYDLEIVDRVKPYVAAWKVGSGDITWVDMLERLSTDNKPILLATGASTFAEVRKAMSILSRDSNDLVLMQCNTNYTGLKENIAYANINVLNSFRAAFPGVVLGLSDHTAGHVTVCTAVALGAKVIEKHFTDDNTREGPDHKFAMTPDTWQKMVGSVRDVELCLGDGVKRVERNELETVVLQRRALRAACDVRKGTMLDESMVIPLRPCPLGALQPDQRGSVVGMQTRRDIPKGDLITFQDVIEAQ